MPVALTQYQKTLQTKGLLYLPVKVIPKSQRTELVEIFTDEKNQQSFKIRLKAVPEKGQANRELIKHLANIFDTPKSNISIVAGQTGRSKLVKITKP